MSTSLSGNVSVGAFSFSGSPQIAAELAGSGFDWICLDSQHGRWDDRSVRDALELAGNNARMLVRVQELSAGLIGRALDAGAAGVIVPMVETVEQAEQLATWSLYPPVGRRSWGPLRMSYGSGVDDVQLINSSIDVVAMIETGKALARVNEIAAVPGITMLFVGPFDLSLALGISVTTLLADDSDEAPLRRIAAAAAASGITAGAFAGTPERAARLIELGYAFVAAASDSSVIEAGSAALLSHLSQVD